MAVNQLPYIDPINDPLQKVGNTGELNLSYPDIIANYPNTPMARRNRQLMRWRVPGMGFVDMYINPQQMTIAEKKIISKQRTKGGFAIQYWGEELINIKISGNTGSSGVEGINILRKIYRAEQESFQQVEQILIDRLSTLSNSLGRIGSFAEQAAQRGIGSAAGNLISDFLGGARNVPLLPTLGSLALSVEMYYQGVVYKGYFEDFNVIESTSNGVGLFNYDMTFVAIDKRGVRTNFMPWHRSPASTDGSGNIVGYNHANSDITPMSFGGEK